MQFIIQRICIPGTCEQGTEEHTLKTPIKIGYISVGFCFRYGCFSQNGVFCHFSISDPY